MTGNNSMYEMAVFEDIPKIKSEQIDEYPFHLMTP